MFFYFFVLFVALGTFFDSFILILGVYVLGFIIIFFLSFFITINYYIKLFISLFLTFLLVLLILYIKLENNNNEDFGNTFIGTGLILDDLGNNKYIIKINKKEYLFKTKVKYFPGDVFFTTSYKKTVNNSFKNFMKNKDIKINFTFNYDKRMFMKGYKGELYDKNSHLIYHTSNFNIISIKHNLKKLVISNYGNNGISGLILGMLIGDKSLISSDDYQNFIDSGLVHIIAVSGGNILILVLFLGYILFFVPFYLRIFLIMISIVFYCFLCGLDSSIIRATIMALLSYIAILFGKSINIFRLLKYSIFIMLFINPYYLVSDLGFQLSYFALFGLILFSKITSLIKKIPIVSKILNEYLFPTIGANLGVFPLLLFNIGKINLLGIIGNIFVIPLVPFIMIYGFISLYITKFIKFQRILDIQIYLIKFVYYISEISVEYGLYLQANNIISKGLIFFFYLIIIIFLYVIYRYKKIQLKKY